MSENQVEESEVEVTLEMVAELAAVNSLKLDAIWNFLQAHVVTDPVPPDIWTPQ